MIKLSPIIEGIKQQRLNRNSLKKLLQNDFGTALRLRKNGIILYRAHENLKSSYEMVYPSASERTSRDGHNLYTVLLSNLPSWKGWPKRSFCIIFTNEESVAAEFESAEGHIVHVLPPDEAKIVVCPSKDLFMIKAFPFLHENIKMTCNQLGWAMFDILSFIMDKYPDSDISLGSVGDASLTQIKHSNYTSVIDTLNKGLTLEKMLDVDAWKEIPPKYTSYPIINIRDYFSKTIGKHHGDWELFFDDLLNPESNGFKLVNLLNISRIHSAREMWTDAHCILVKIK